MRIKYTVHGIIFIILIIQNGCVNSSQFDTSLFKITSTHFDIDEVDVDSSIVRVGFSLTNKSGRDICYRRYERDGGGQNPYIIVNKSFSLPPPPSAGVAPHNPYTEATLQPNETKEFIALGMYSGVRNELLYRGKFVITFFEYDCLDRKNPKRIRSDVMNFSTFLKAD